MAVESVASSSNTTQAALQKAAENQPARQAERQEAKKAEEPPPVREESPRPVVNAEGQTTGSVINVTA